MNATVREAIKRNKKLRRRFLFDKVMRKKTHAKPGHIPEFRTRAQFDYREWLAGIGVKGSRNLMGLGKSKGLIVD